MGYHVADVSRGEYGKTSKIREELEELEDAVLQENKILAHVELSDLYGALEGVAESMGLSMEDLRRMSDATKRAFRDGSRPSR